MEVNTFFKYVQYCTFILGMAFLAIGTYVLYSNLFEDEVIEYVLLALGFTFLMDSLAFTYIIKKRKKLSERNP